MTDASTLKHRFYRTCDGCRSIVYGAWDYPCEECGSLEGPVIPMTYSKFSVTPSKWPN
jgi:hypothetical protein